MYDLGLYLEFRSLLCLYLEIINILALHFSSLMYFFPTTLRSRYYRMPVFEKFCKVQEGAWVAITVSPWPWCLNNKHYLLQLWGYRDQDYGEPLLYLWSLCLVPMVEIREWARLLLPFSYKDANSIASVLPSKLSYLPSLISDSSSLGLEFSVCYVASFNHSIHCKKMNYF